MRFAEEYAALEERFRQQVDDHRQTYNLEPHQEIFVPMAFFPAMPARRDAVDTVFIGMYPSQNWLTAKDPTLRLNQANSLLAQGFRISLSTVWDVVFHLAIRKWLCSDVSTYYVTDISKGAMKPGQRPGHEKATRDWDSWYRLLQEETKLVLNGNRQRTARVIPVGGEVETFLHGKAFGEWLESQRLGQLMPRVTHWAWGAYRADESRRNSLPPPKRNFVSNYGSRLNQLAEQLLNEVSAGDWWREHLKSNLAEISDPWTEWWCERLFERYQREFSKIREAKELRQESAPLNDAVQHPTPSHKQRFANALDELPDTATLDDIEDRLWSLIKLDRGVEDADAGRVIPEEEVEEHYSYGDSEEEALEEEESDEEEEDKDEEDWEEAELEIGYGLTGDLAFEEEEDEE